MQLWTGLTGSATDISIQTVKNLKENLCDGENRQMNWPLEGC